MGDLMHPFVHTQHWVHDTAARWT